MKPFNENNPMEIKFDNSQCLHGDVIIEKVKSLPENFDQMPKEPNDALAYGEATGHLHKLFRLSGSEAQVLPGEFELKNGSDGVKYLKVISPVMLKHQEHEPRQIPPGLYIVKPQREYDPFEKRALSVAD